jgi:hypothetical protein
MDDTKKKEKREYFEAGGVDDIEVRSVARR